MEKMWSSLQTFIEGTRRYKMESPERLQAVVQFNMRVELEN